VGSGAKRLHAFPHKALIVPAEVYKNTGEAFLSGVVRIEIIVMVVDGHARLHEFGKTLGELFRGVTLASRLPMTAKGEDRIPPWKGFSSQDFGDFIRPAENMSDTGRQLIILAPLIKRTGAEIPAYSQPSDNGFHCFLILVREEETL
jgi:hypothetical protein